MTVDPALLRALRQSVGNDPDNVPARLHLAQVLLDADEPDDALDELTGVLDLEPANIEAFALAAEACDELGLADRATAYRRLIAALAALDGTTVPASLARRRVRAAGRDEDWDDDDLDDDLDDADLDLDEDDDDADAHDALRHGWIVEDTDPPVTLVDAVGLEDVARRLEAVLVTLRHPDLAARVRRPARGAVLLYGPAGCGKTLLTRAVAGELSRPRFSVELPELLDGSAGGGERLHAVFEAARAKAPCVLVIDGLDALTGEGHDVDVPFLVEVDSLANDDAVLVMATSSVPWDIDPALRRPGRFDRAILVPPPNTPSRVAMVEHLLVDWPVKDLDVDALASQLDGYSYADISLITETAAERALEAAYTSEAPWEVSGFDIERVVGEVRPSTRSWLELAHGSVGGFAGAVTTYGDLLAYLRAHPVE
jgi:SpoVK/Ycf46/Vps4 family AAA+-type ATPase